MQRGKLIGDNPRAIKEAVCRVREAIQDRIIKDHPIGEVRLSQGDSKETLRDKLGAFFDAIARVAETTKTSTREESSIIRLNTIERFKRCG